MTFYTIKKEDFKKYHYQLALVSAYTIILGIVYGYWTMVALNLYYLGVIVFLAFILAGSLVYYFWINYLKNKREKVED